jgi:3-oxoacyl-[acyl-carrier-protein] synthase III
MGVRIDHLHAFVEEGRPPAPAETGSVFKLAQMCLNQVIHGGVNYGYLVCATSCPDTIAPSLGQCINQHYNKIFCSSHVIDLVQGCTGGVSALILGSQLAEANRCNVAVIVSDAAKKATSVSSAVYPVFKNGVFGCCISYSADGPRMIHHQSCQYKDLYTIISIGLGHDADTVITKNRNTVCADPRKYLGLKLNNNLAIKLMQKAESFYLDFIAVTGHPDILILHQVNVVIVNHLQKVFEKYPVVFINVAKQTGNCGAATTGITLDLIKDKVKNKKVMICSFGTGGAIIAGLWQF